MNILLIGGEEKIQAVKKALLTIPWKEELIDGLEELLQPLDPGKVKFFSLTSSHDLKKNLKGIHLAIFDYPFLTMEEVAMVQSTGVKCVVILPAVIRGEEGRPDCYPVTAGHVMLTSPYTPEALLLSVRMLLRNRPMILAQPIPVEEIQDKFQQAAKAFLQESQAKINARHDQIWDDYLKKNEAHIRHVRQEPEEFIALQKRGFDEERQADLADVTPLTMEKWAAESPHQIKEIFFTAFQRQLAATPLEMLQAYQDFLVVKERESQIQAYLDSRFVQKGGDTFVARRVAQILGHN